MCLFLANNHRRKLAKIFSGHESDLLETARDPLSPVTHMICSAMFDMAPPPPPQFMHGESIAHANTRGKPSPIEDIPTVFCSAWGGGDHNFSLRTIA